MNYQGRVLVDGRVFDGTGRFKFALVNADASQTWWRSAPDANADGEPDMAVEVPVARGLYALLLGDTRLANMAALPPAALEHDEVYLRVWFSGGPGAFEKFVPDHQFAAAGYSLLARTVQDGAITTAKLAPDAITPALVPALDAGKITTGQLDPARLPAAVAQDSDVDALRATVTALTARVITLEAGGGGSGPAGVLASRNPADPALEAAGFGRFISFSPPPWRDGALGGALSARSGHAAAWNGARWLIWGGQNGTGQALSSGSIYDPAADQWAEISTLSAPSARADHSAVWTGAELIIWGGASGADLLNTGGRYVPGASNWRATATNNAPTARVGHVAAWCAGRMLVWGGRNFDGLQGGGALYDPVTDIWTPLNLPGAPTARQFAASAVGGNSVFIWGGEGEAGLLATGAELVLNPDGTAVEWRAINPAGAPAARLHHTAVWTGSRLLVWGGLGTGGAFLSSGAAYDAATGTWAVLPATDAPTARARHNAVWTGLEMLILAGEAQSGPQASGNAYDPAALRWRPLGVAGGPSPRHSATAAWTGGEVLIFGGVGPVLGGPLADLERLDPAGAWHLFRKP
ncbi:MAG: Kelch repeat-containing protein [Limisphaerales bacterium]